MQYQFRWETCSLLRQTQAVVYSNLIPHTPSCSYSLDPACQMYDNSNINAIILHLRTIMPQLYDVQFNFLVDGIVMLIYS